MCCEKMQGEVPVRCPVCRARVLESVRWTESVDAGLDWLCADWVVCGRLGYSGVDGGRLSGLRRRGWRGGWGLGCVVSLLWWGEKMIENVSGNGFTGFRELHDFNEPAAVDPRLGDSENQESLRRDTLEQ